MFTRRHGLRPLAVAASSMVCGLLSLNAAAAAAAPPPPPAAGQLTTMTDGCGPGPAGAPFMMGGEPRMDTVKNAPYSGVGTTEVVQTLGDGNRIVRTNTMRYARDSQGRTRTEYSLGAIGPFTPDQAQTLVTINDPVGGKRFVLHSAMKHASVFDLTGMTMGMPMGMAMPPGRGAFFHREVGTSIDIVGGPMTGTAEAGATLRAETGAVPPPPAPPLPPGAGQSANVLTTIVAPGGPQAFAAQGIAAPPLVVMSGSVGMAPPNAAYLFRTMPGMPAGMGCRPGAKPLPEPASLGERTIEGLKVSGNQREFTIAAGVIGNEQPIVVRTEQWFSSELGVVVASTHHDPMIGDTTYKLEQISRAEPDPALFTVPADYTKDEMPSMPAVKFKTVEPPKGK